MQRFENFAEMFAQSIGLAAPWRIECAEFDEERGAVHVYVSAQKTAQYPCSACGKNQKRYDDEERERVWRHGDVVFFPCYIHCRRPRTQCAECGTRVVTAPWARKNSRFTLLFESYAMLLVEKLPVEQARKLLRISHTSLTNILRHWVHKMVDADNLGGVDLLAIDETSFKRGQSYVTVISDVNTRRVVDVQDGRGAQQVEDFSFVLEEKGGSCEDVKQVACDMSAAYLSGIAMCFPNATPVIDRFHVKKLMLGAMDKVRREEQGATHKQRKMGRKLLMIPEWRMTEQQHAKMTELSRQYPKTGRAFRMVQALDVIYWCKDVTEAKVAFDKLISWLRRSRLQPRKKVAKTLLKHEKEILAYFLARLTNAIAEGINSLIQAGKRKARGFRTFEGFRCMIYLTCSKLPFAPLPLFA